MDEFEKKIEAVCKRWPALGAAADHPLTEWLAGRKSQRSIVLIEITELAMLLVAFIFVWVYVFSSFSLLEKQITLAVYFLVTFPLMYYRRKGAFGLTNWFVRKDPGQMCDLRMSPLTFRQLLAIEAVSRILQPSLRSFRIARFVLGTGFTIYCIEKFLVQNRLNDFPPYLRLLAYIFTGLMGVAGWRMRRELRLRQAMRNLWVNVVPKSELFKPNKDRIKFVAVIAFCQIGMFVIIANFKPGFTSVLLIVFGVTAFIMLVIMPFEQTPVRTEQMYEQLAQTGERHYRGTVDSG